MLKINIQKIIIIGHSQGGLIGIDFASRYPELTEKIVLVANSYKMPVNQELIDLAEAGDDKSVLLMMQWGFEGSKAFFGGNDGLFFYKKFARKLPKLMKFASYLILEIGENQALYCIKLFSNYGLNLVKKVKDLQKKDRILIFSKL